MNKIQSLQAIIDENSTITRYNETIKANIDLNRVKDNNESENEEDG